MWLERGRQEGVGGEAVRWAGVQAVGTAALKNAGLPLLELQKSLPHGPTVPLLALQAKVRVRRPPQTPRQMGPLCRGPPKHRSPQPQARNTRNFQQQGNTQQTGTRSCRGMQHGNREEQTPGNNKVNLTDPTVS